LSIVADERPVAPEETLAVASLLSLSGGFLDAFTYVGHGGVFANAMTGNVVLLAVYTASGEWLRGVSHIPPLFAFLFGVFTARALRHAGKAKHIALLGLTLEMLVLGGLTFLPRDYPDIGIVLTISYVAAVQNSGFTRIRSWSYNSVMTTGNLRRLAENLFDGSLPRRNVEAREQAWVFAAICFSFLVGAFLGGVTTPLLANAALGIPVAVLALALLLCLEVARPRFRKPVNEE
jgi:uncharacterized membrane protein YoaK (UPF0700 family)